MLCFNSHVSYFNLDVMCFKLDINCFKLEFCYFKMDFICFNLDLKRCRCAVCMLKLGLLVDISYLLLSAGTTFCFLLLIPIAIPHSLLVPTYFKFVFHFLAGSAATLQILFFLVLK